VRGRGQRKTEERVTLCSSLNYAKKSSPTERLVRHKQVDSAPDGDDSLEVQQAGLGRDSRGAVGKEQEQ
jgi:hypothetical protein